MNILGQKLSDVGDKIFYGNVELKGVNSNFLLKGADILADLQNQKNINNDNEQRIINLENETRDLRERIFVLEGIISSLTTEDGEG
jgi:hypothetical protein